MYRGGRPEHPDSCAEVTEYREADSAAPECSHGTSVGATGHYQPQTGRLASFALLCSSRTVASDFRSHLIANSFRDVEKEG